jgi:hypothetical protein
MDDVVTDPHCLVLEVPPWQRPQELRIVQRCPVVVAGDADNVALERFEPVCERTGQPLSWSQITRDKQQITRRDDRKQLAMQI